MFFLRKKKEVKKENIFDFLVVIVEALVLALFIRSFLFQPFNIPSGSMRPTLLKGDYLFVSKYAYGYSRYSFPLSLNLFSGRIWGTLPQRGDIVVFRLPSDPSVDYIKRVIGLPGDKIQIKEGVVYINDMAVKRDQLARLDDFDITDINSPVDLYKETLPNGVSYNTLDIFPESPANNTRVFLVPENHYFMMGDNRDNSLDSRFDVGYVPFENLIGRANLLFFSLKGNVHTWELWKWPSSIRYSRLFRQVTGLWYDDIKSKPLEKIVLDATFV